MHCTSFLAMYAPSKYGGGVVCASLLDRGVCVCVCVCVCVVGEVRGEVKEERPREGGGGHVLLLTSRKFSPMASER